jgi:hypothetical protein
MLRRVTDVVFSFYKVIPDFHPLSGTKGAIVVMNRVPDPESGSPTTRLKKRGRRRRLAEKPVVVGGKDGDGDYGGGGKLPVDGKTSASRVRRSSSYQRRKALRSKAANFARTAKSGENRPKREAPTPGRIGVRGDGGWSKCKNKYHADGDHNPFGTFWMELERVKMFNASRKDGSMYFDPNLPPTFYPCRRHGNKLVSTAHWCVAGACY